MYVPASEEEIESIFAKKVSGSELTKERSAEI